MTKYQVIPVPDMVKKLNQDSKNNVRSKDFQDPVNNMPGNPDSLKIKIEKLEQENKELRKNLKTTGDLRQALAESEEKYELLLKSSKNAIMIIQKGVITYSNPSGLRALGYSHINELTGKSFYELLDPLSYDNFRYKLHRMDEGFRSESAQLKLLRKDGSGTLFEFTVLPVSYNNNKSILAIGQNITPWKETELALRGSEQKLKSLFDSAPDYYFITDLNYNIRFFNRLLPGYKTTELINKSIMKIFTGKQADVAGKCFNQVMNSLTTQGFEILISKQKRNVWYSCRIAAMLIENKPDGYIVVLTDITQQKESKIKLVESEKRYVSLFDNIQSGVIILQPDRTSNEYLITNINKAGLRIYGKSKSKIKGTNFYGLLNSYKKSGIDDKLQIVREVGKSQFINAHYFQDEKFTGWLEHYIYRISGGEIIVVVEDVTEKHIANNELVKARQEWQDIFEAIGQPTIILDPEQNIIAANKSVLELTGKSLDELKRHKCFEIFHAGKNKHPENCPMQKLLQSKIPQTCEMEIETLSGIFMVSCTPVLDSDGEMTKIIHIATDITAIKKAKTELKSSLQRYQKLLDTIPYGVDEINMEGKIILTNPAHARMLHCRSQDIAGRTIFDLQATDEEREFVINYFKKIIAEHPEPSPFIGKNNTCNGEVIDVQVDWNYLEDSEGVLQGFITVISNITERIRFEKALNEAKVKAEESDRLKSAFLTNMSHEIRTPLNGIIGFSSMLTDDNLKPEKRKSYVNYILEGANQLLTIIGNVIDISKLESGQLSIIMKPFNLDSMMSDLQVLFENESVKLNKKGLRIVYGKPEAELQEPVLSDEIRLKQVLNNLLSNALKFTEKGSIEFGYKRIKKEKLRFFVKDTGIGIAKQFHSAIFERFRQEDDSYTREFGGAGLGLAISKAIVQKLGGKIWVESEKEKGSVFYFTIPFITQQKERDQESEQNVIYDWRDKKILVVEDDKLNAELVKATLKPTGVSLIFARDGEEAIDCFRRYFDINLVLLDIRLPYIDGYGVAKHMKKLNPDIRILAYSAYAMDKEKLKADNAGVDGYLTKPTRPKEMLETIHTLLNY